MKLLSSREATLQPEATLFFPLKRQESCELAHPVFHTLGSAACMRTACKWQRKPRCIETKCLRPGEFTQRVAINPPSQIFLFNSAITMPIKVQLSCEANSWQLFDMHSWRMGYCICVKSAKRHYCEQSDHACVIYMVNKSGFSNCENMGKSSALADMSICILTFNHFVFYPLICCIHWVSLSVHVCLRGICTETNLKHTRINYTV